MNLTALKPSFIDLDPSEQIRLIEEIRLRRQQSLVTIKARRERAAKSASAPKHHKQAIFSLENLTPEQALQLLAMLEEPKNET